MMKKILSVTVLGAWCGLHARAAEPATLSKNASPGGSTASYAGKLGAGVIVGEPTGGSVKYWFNDTLAIDGTIGWSSHDNTDLYLHSDVLWHNFDLIPVTRGRLPVYFGVGGLMRIRDNNNDNQVGVRVPVRLSYMFDNAPWTSLRGWVRPLTLRRIFAEKSPAAAASVFGSDQNN